MYIVGTGFATEPGLPEGTTLELAIVPLIPTQHQLETEDPLMMGDDDIDIAEGARADLSNAESKSEPAATPKPKKCKVTHQDIQAMQLEVLKVERNKIEAEVENLKLVNQKLKLEIEELRLKNQVNFFN